MEDMTKMANKAIVPEHNKVCRCPECLAKAARVKAAERNKEAARLSTS